MPADRRDAFQHRDTPEVQPRQPGMLTIIGTVDLPCWPG